MFAKEESVGRRRCYMFINFVSLLFEGKFSNFREEIPGDIFLCFPSLSFFVKVIKHNGRTEQKC